MGETPWFHGRGHGFDPGLGKFHMLHNVAKKKKISVAMYIHLCNV